MTVSRGILEQIVRPEIGNFPPEHAEYVFSLTFPKAAIKRYLKLSAKAQAGTLTAAEESELDVRPAWVSSASRCSLRSTA